MKHIYSKIAFGLILCGGGLNAMAAEYISAPMSVSPQNNSYGQMFGQVRISWQGVQLEMDNRDKDALPSDYNYIDPSFLTITVGGQEVSLNNTQMGGRIFTKVVQESNEQNGGGTGGSIDMLYIDFPDTYFLWKGEVNVDLKEGAVTSTTGEINPDINLTYYFVDVNENITWEPAYETTFAQGTCVIYASWEGATITINDNASTAPFIQKEDPQNDDKLGPQVSVTNLMSVENGKLKFNFVGLEAGVYSLTIPEGSILLGDNVINNEAFYNFVIAASVPAPEYQVKALPSEYDWFDGFSVMWAQNFTQPYSLVSQYAVYDENQEKYVFNEEGISLFQVKENGTDPVEILSISLEEYQQDENTTNYPAAQLVITLAEFQTNVGSRYSLSIPAGVVTIVTPEGETENQAVSYTFTLAANQAFELPDPIIISNEGLEVDENAVCIVWEGVLGSYDLLNLNQENTQQITVESEALNSSDFTVTFSWSSKEAETPGADGDILVINFNEPLVENAQYVINIPASYVYVTDIDKGTLPNEVSSLLYTASTSGVESLKVLGNNDKIFNLNGQAVNISNLSNLPKGVYIINGKKVMVK